MNVITQAKLLAAIQRSADFARAAFPDDVDQRASSFISHFAGSLYGFDTAASDLVFDLLFNRIALPNESPTTATATGA